MWSASTAELEPYEDTWGSEEMTTGLPHTTMTPAAPEVTIVNGKIAEGGKSDTMAIGYLPREIYEPTKDKAGYTYNGGLNWRHYDFDGYEENWRYDLFQQPIWYIKEWSTLGISEPRRRLKTRRRLKEYNNRTRGRWYRHTEPVEFESALGRLTGHPFSARNIQRTL